MNSARLPLLRHAIVSLALATALAAVAHAATISDADGTTPLHLAALRNDAAAVEALLAAGADASAINHAGATPLHYGIGSERIVAALLAHGAPADAVSNVGMTPLLSAASRADSFAVVRRLIEAGANVNGRRTRLNPLLAEASVLALAIIGGDMRSIALLLEHGAEVNPGQGISPLHAAAYAGDVETARLLLDRGADINYVATTAGALSGTPLTSALVTRHDAVATLLIERGADPGLKTLHAYATPPMVLSAYNDAGDPAMARLLLAHGVDVNSANEAGESALSYALKRGDDTPLVRFLRESGATEPISVRREKTIPARDVPTDAATRAAMIRDSAQRAVELLQRTSTAFLESNGSARGTVNCTSCHQQSLPAVAFGLARERGLRVDDHEVGRQLTAWLAVRAPQAEPARQLDQPTPGAQVALGYDADGLHALRYAPDAMTSAMSHYLLGVQRVDGSWAGTLSRPPMEDGPVIATAWCVRAIQLYPPAGREREVDDALRRARAWLAAQPAPTANERIFQLLGLAWAGETPDRMRPFAETLMATQRNDGGWAQLPALASDAWATGSALVALDKAGTPATHATYQRGIAFLLRTQFDDGSWWVRSRAWPFQPHFDGKFPHGKDQWISAAGTAWATIALLLTTEPTTDPANLPTVPQLIATYRRAEEQKRMAPAEAAPVSPTTIDFVRDIQPLFERSCLECHSGAKPKGLFDLTSRAALLRGGQSGEPAIVPGFADESPMVRQIVGAIEDLEMPPLRRRDKFPALSDEEVARLRVWIDAGAPWPASIAEHSGAEAKNAPGAAALD